MHNCLPEIRRISTSGEWLLLALLFTLSSLLLSSPKAQGSTSSLTLAPAAWTPMPVVQGSSATTTFTMTTGGSFQGSITMGVSGLPSGVTGTWSSSTVTPTANSASSTLTLTASSSAALASTTITVTATGASTSASHSYTLQVQSPPGISVKLSKSSISMQSMGTTTLTLTATPVGGVAVPPDYSGSAPAIISGLPAGFTSTWSSPSMSGSAEVWTLTLTGTPSAVASSGTLTLAAQVTDANSGQAYSASQGIPLTVTLTAPTLSISPASTQVPVVQGASATDAFSLTTGGSFQGSVSLAVSGLPSGVTASWSSSTVTPVSGSASSTLSVSATAAAATGSTNFTVTATGGGLTVTKTYSVQVQQAPGVTVKLNHQSLSMSSMGTTTVTLTATPIGGVTVPANFAGASSSILSGLPTGITASWSSPSFSSGAVVWTLTLTGTPNAVASSGSLSLSGTVTDANSNQSYSAGSAIPLTVSYTAPTLSVSAAATHVYVQQAATSNDLLTINGGGSYQGAVTMAVSGLPAGVTGSFSSPTVTLSSGTGTTTLSLVATAGSPTNYFKFTVTATGDGLTVTQNYGVTVEPANAGGVNVLVSQPTLPISASASATLTVTADPMDGIVVPSNLAGVNATITSSLPAGVTSTWSAPSLDPSSGNVTWTLTLNADNTLQAGSYPLALNVQIVDANSGFTYTGNPTFNLLASLLASVNVGNTPGLTIPPSFLGLSFEWADAQATMGDSTRINPIFSQLISNLIAYGAGPFNLRIGGNSTDTTGEPTATTVAPFVEVANSLGAQFELGVNLGANNVNLAVDQATAYVNQMPAGSLLALEIGNEPDEYSTNGLRPSGYTVQNYYSEFDTWKQAITPVLPSGTQLMGAAWAFVATLQSNAPTFLSGEANALALFSQHSYGTSPSNNPAPDYLLTPAASASFPAQFASSVAASHAQGVPFRIGETGSCSVGGIHGMSDTFSAALWSIDNMFEYANNGVDGVNWFSSNGSYNSPFYFTNTTSKGVTKHVLTAINPLYYGLLFFEQATQNGAQLLPASLSTASNVKTWATVDANGTPRLTILNKDETNAGSVSVTIPGYTQATVTRLVAPSYSSSNGITLGGQTFDGSQDGNIQGTPTNEVIRGANGVFKIPMTVTSAALVTFN